MKTTKRLLCLLVALVMLFSVSYLVACDTEDDNSGTGGNSTGGGTTTPDADEDTGSSQYWDDADVYDAGTYGTDYTSQWEFYGTEISVDDVFYSTTSGMPAVMLDGVETELGMDYLSMAMVYNTENAEVLTSTEQYNLWFQYYVVRWNYLMPNVPLYSNVYYDCFSDDISGFVTTAYWAPSDAIVNSTTTASDSMAIIGSTTELAGLFQVTSWGTSSSGASDQDINGLIYGYSTLSMDKYGAYAVDDNVVSDYTETTNDDDTKTYTVTIVDGLEFSDGSAITAENYVLSVLAGSTEVAVEAGGSGYSGMYFEGYDDFNEDLDGGCFFEGVKLSADKMTFSVTVSAEYLPYYYSYIYAGLTPTHTDLYFGAKSTSSTSLSITTDTTGVTEGGVEVFACGLSDAFYAMTGSSYDMAATIKTQIYSTDGSVPTSGPYMLTSTSWDATDKTCILSINTYFTGEANRSAPTIEKVGFAYVTTANMHDKLSQGEVDIISGLTGADDVNGAIALVEAGGFSEVHYDRAGYGMVAFRADFGPTMYTGVRQAISYIMDTADFANVFCGGFGSVVYGPFGTTTSGYVANQSELADLLVEYARSQTKAQQAVIDAGFIYNADGSLFDSADGDTIRYVKLEGEYLTVNNLLYASVDDSSVCTVLAADGCYYMPLVINWMGSTDNTVTTMLISAFAENVITGDVGMDVTQTQADFTTLCGEYYTYTPYGWDGTYVYNCFNLASGFTSSIYDYSYGWTIDPDKFTDYSAFYMMDSADYVWLDADATTDTSTDA